MFYIHEESLGLELFYSSNDRVSAEALNSSCGSDPVEAGSNQRRGGRARRSRAGKRTAVDTITVYREKKDKVWFHISRSLPNLLLVVQCNLHYQPPPIAETSQRSTGAFAGLPTYSSWCRFPASTKPAARNGPFNRITHTIFYNLYDKFESNFFSQVLQALKTNISILPLSICFFLVATHSTVFSFTGNNIILACWTYNAQQGG